MLWAALIHQKTPFWKITTCFILKLKTMYCNRQIIIPIGSQQYFSTNYVFLLNFQMQIWKGFFSQMNLTKRTLWGQLIIYSLNTLLRIRWINNLHREHIQKYVNCWCNTKKRWLRNEKLHIDFSNLLSVSSKFDSSGRDWWWFNCFSCHIASYTVLFEFPNY